MKKLLKISSVVAIVLGVIMTIGGIWGICFTYSNIAKENIVTPADALISQKAVRGPLTLYAQSDIIRKHVLESTKGKTFAEMPREVQKLDASGQPEMAADGKPVMTANTARDIWITATTLTTALNLGILAYAFFSLVLMLGCIALFAGFIFHKLAIK